MVGMHCLTPRTLRRSLPLIASCALLPVASLLAGPARVDNSKDKNITQSIMDDITPLNQLDMEVSYVGESDFHTKKVNGESQGEIESSFQYGHRFHLFGKVYLKLGAAYERFDFSVSDTPLPSTLQSIAGVVAVEYIEKGTPGIFITSKPGIYFSDTHDISAANFDFPTSLGAIIPINKSVYVLVGIHTSILSKYPVFPIGGLVVLFNDHLRLEAIPPEPRLIYTVNEKLDFFVGGEILGDAFKRDDTNYRGKDHRFSGGVIDYSEYRVGGGLTLTPIKQVDIDISGGWALERSFDYYRGDQKNFTTTGAPYAKLSVSAEF
jgi:hypothetical protein